MITSKSAYERSGVSYRALDPVKIAAQRAAKATARQLLNNGGKELSQTRGESAYVWRQGSMLMASVIEGLGTKNLVADAMRRHTKKTYYDVVAHDTVATIINDLVTVGARPLVLHAYWAAGNSSWFADKKQVSDLILGWRQACVLAGVTWGGGETPVYAGIIDPSTIDLAGSAIGIVPSKKHLITQDHITSGDHIIFVRSNGINANGLTLARKAANESPNGYLQKLPSGKRYGDALLAKSNIYARLISALQDAQVDIHYIVHITGHGLRKLMRPKKSFTFCINAVFEPQEEFHYIQKAAGLSMREMYETFNMGQDYALYVPPRSVKKIIATAAAHGFECIDAGVILKGKKQVLVKQHGITFHESSLRIRP